MSPLLNGGVMMSFPWQPLTPFESGASIAPAPPTLIPLLEPTPNEPSKSSPRIKSAIIKKM